MDTKISETPIIILSGGYGIFIDEFGERKAKANILIHGKPLIYFVILSYLKHGFRDFYISGSYQLEATEKLLQKAFDSKFTFKNQNFSLKFFDTGLHTKTGNRISRMFEHLPDSENFGVTYSDTLSLQNLDEEFKYHIDSNLTCTITGARLPTRFRLLGIRPGENIVRGIADRPLFKGDYIAGGFYFFKSDIMKDTVWNQETSIALEYQVLDKLTATSQLIMYTYEGDWQYLDCERDLHKIATICEKIKTSGES